MVDDYSEIPFDISSFDITYIRNDRNLGSGFSRNVGLENASGNYIVFLDCDDYWESDFLNCMVSALKQNPHIVMAYCNAYDIDSENNLVEKRPIGQSNPNSILPDILNYGRMWVTGACVWNKNMIKNVRWLNTTAWEDYAFDISCGIICNDVIMINKYLMYYDISGNDKLSLRKEELSIKEKSKSLKYISSQIKNSNFYYDIKIKKRIKILILSNLIGLIKCNVREKKYYIKNIDSLKSYSGFFTLVIAYFCTILKNRIGLILLRRIRNLD